MNLEESGKGILETLEQVKEIWKCSYIKISKNKNELNKK